MPANPMPTSYAVDCFGAGNVRVFQLVAGLSLGDQVGNDLVKTKEPSTAGTHPHNNRVVEAFGRVFLLDGSNVYRLNTGTNNWDSVHTLTPMTLNGYHGGLHTVVVEGRTFIVVVWADRGGANGVFKAVSPDGVNWTTTQIIADSGSALGNMGVSSIVGTSYWWWVRRADPWRLVRHDFATGATTTYANDTSNFWGDSVDLGGITGARGTTYVFNTGTNGFASRLVGASFVTLPGGSAFGAIQSFPAHMNTHTFLTLEHGGTTGAWAVNEIVTGQTSGATGLIIEGGIDGGDTWIMVDSVDGDFQIGETILGGTSGATAVVSAVELEEEGVFWYFGSGGPNTFAGLMRNPRSGSVPGVAVDQFAGNNGIVASFRSQDPNPLNQRTYMWFRSGANVFGAVVYQLYRLDHFGAAISLTSLGSLTIQADQWALLSSYDGGAERIYSGGTAASPEWGTRATNLQHGTVSGSGFVLGETITGGTSGATGVIVEKFDGQTKVVNETGTFVNGEVIAGGTSGESATLSAGPDEDATFPPREVSGGLRRRYFRVYGDGGEGPLSFGAYYSGPDISGAPEVEQSSSLAVARATITGVGVAAGSPPTTPSLASNLINNLTADGGATLYYVDIDSVTDGLAPGQGHLVTLDPV